MYFKKVSFTLILSVFVLFGFTQTRSTISFNKDWKFKLVDDSTAKNISFDDSKWRTLNLPHDWSIEFPFDSTSPTGNGGGALRGGLAWYRKTFTVSETNQSKNIFIDFDGVYKNSEVWINGHYLGKRPNGYISFEYELTPYLKFGSEKNVIAVKVDNSKQPNSRWYSGSGIYRNVWLVSKEKISVDHWGTFITTPTVTNASASVVIKINLINQTQKNKNVKLVTSFLNSDGKEVAKVASDVLLSINKKETEQKAAIKAPVLWSDTHPYLYKAVTTVIYDKKIMDVYETTFGIRSFKFDVDKGFLLNGKHVKIKGVCDHHDLGCLGTAVNTRALERQLELLKGMGCNAIRTSHNPPAPELLALADKMGFIIMDEAFDMWKKEKTKFDYHLDWDQWHVKDLQDQILRDRNHPSVFIWSLGNEIQEQWGNDEDSSGTTIIKELNAIVKSLDTSRPTVTANNEIHPWNKLLKAKVADLVGYNYHINYWNKDTISKFWGNKPFIVTESVSALETRGHYDHLRSDSIRRWPGVNWDDPCSTCNSDLTVNAYDNVSAGWGSTHEETMKLFQKNDFISGQFIWTGFDYIGEPTPYPWPARSSYFGIIDLAGFPKDVYYMYQSVWTDKTVLHILPHWNWKNGDTVDVWAYYNHADDVELFLNGKSLGTKKKVGDDLHVMWRVPFVAGTIKAVSKKDGKIVLTKEIKTAGKPAKIELIADRKNIKADGKDLSFITARVVDAAGNIVPDADNLIRFSVKGEAEIVGTDNGLQTSMESFKSSQHKAFNGLCLAVVQSKEKEGNVIVTASSQGLQTVSVIISIKK
ncbi:beta-galactosidase BoGH2A precursor [mine drainage metagenome]|uniref:Beta-galactosidase BoGH2A n=1 Tax=mine drainage metagenome TaxID=410659 RepID=A0A1J5SM70_9ZZZZ